MPISVASTSHPLLRLRRTDAHRPASMDARAGDLHDLTTPREVGGHVVLDRLFFTYFVCVLLSCWFVDRRSAASEYSGMESSLVRLGT